MPKKTSKIYMPTPLLGRNVEDLIWGVTPGGHVAHLIDPAKTTSFSAISDRAMTDDKYNTKSSVYEIKKVSQGMVYNNAGDNATAKTIAMENRLQHTSDILADYLEKNPALRERANILRAQKEMNTEEVKEAAVKAPQPEVKKDCNPIAP